jgi:hypothetical protein
MLWARNQRRREVRGRESRSKGVRLSMTMPALRELENDNYSGHSLLITRYEELGNFWVLLLGLLKC